MNINRIGDYKYFEDFPKTSGWKYNMLYAWNTKRIDDHVLLKIV